MRVVVELEKIYARARGCSADRYTVGYGALGAIK